MTLVEEFTAMKNAGVAFQYIVARLKDFFLNQEPRQQRWDYPIDVMLHSPAVDIINSLSDHEFELLDNILEAVGIQHNFLLTLDFKEHDGWYVNIVPIPPDFDPDDPDDDDDIEPHAEYEQPQVAMAMAARAR